MSLSRQTISREITLLPHQAEFVENFFGQSGTKLHLLRGHVGMGKSSALAALASRLMRERPSARALIIAPATLRVQFLDMLQTSGTPSQVVDSYRYRELLDTALTQEVWPSGTVAVLSVDFAKQSAVLESLANTKWDLVIVDEAQVLRGGRTEILQKLSNSAERIVLATATGAELPEFLKTENITTTEWLRERIVDDGGIPLLVPAPIVMEVPYVSSSSEVKLLEKIRAFSHEAQRFMTEEWIIKLLVNRAQSSPQALESMLRRLEKRLTENLEAKPNSSADNGAEQVHHNLELAIALVHDALAEIDALKEDTKLERFVQLLNKLEQSPLPQKRICILTRYVATQYYLAAALDGEGKEFSILRTSLNRDEQHRALERFIVDGSILVSTAAAVPGKPSWSKVTDLILYERPGKKALEQILMNFNSFGRQQPLNVHIMVFQERAEITHSQQDFGF